MDLGEVMSELIGLADQLKKLAESGATVEIDVALEVGPVRPCTVGFWRGSSTPCDRRQARGWS
jgi:hypothetical protein